MKTARTVPNRPTSVCEGRSGLQKPSERCRILIVDDEPVLRQTLTIYLQNMEGFEIYEASNGFDGLILLQQIGPLDGVLVDVNMPGMDGLEFVRRVKELDRTIVAIIITGFPSIDVIVEALRAGASDFLTKPFELDNLRVALQRLSRERQILVENQNLTEELRAKKALEAINKRLERKTREQTILFTISETLSKTHSTQELYQQVVALACSLTETKQACFWVVNQESKLLVLMAARGPHRPSREQISSDHPNVPCARVAHDGLPVIVMASTETRGRKGSPWDERIFVPFKIRNEVFGVLSVAEPRVSGSLREEALFLLNILAERASLTVENLFLYESVTLNLHATLRALVRTLEAKDPYTKQHSHRVTELSLKLAQLMGCSEDEIDSLRIAGYLHDIGKIGVRDNILMKTGRLTPDEYDVIKMHPVIGEDIVSHLPAEKELIRHHHERWDGEGYPDGLKGLQIPRLSRILAVADTFDAVTSTRPYRAQRSRRAAVEVIKRNASSQFDPDVVEAFDAYMKTK